MAYVSTSMNDQPHGADEEAHAHPTERQYIRIAILLATITLAEVAIYYIDALSGVLVPLLVVMSAVKFVFVVGYFMHLKFDDKRLAWIFASGMLLALSVFIGAWAVMHFDAVTNFVSDML